MALKFSNSQYVEFKGRVIDDHGIFKVTFDISDELVEKIYSTFPSKPGRQYCDYCHCLRLYRFMKILGAIANGIHDDAAIFLEYVVDVLIVNRLTDMVSETPEVLSTYKPPKVTVAYATRLNTILYHDPKLPNKAVASLTQMLAESYCTKDPIFVPTIRMLISGDYKSFVETRILPGYCSASGDEVILSKLERISFRISIIMSDDYPDRMVKYLEFDDGEKELLHKLLITYELNGSMLIPYKGTAHMLKSKNPLITKQEICKKLSIVAKQIVAMFGAEFGIATIGFVEQLCGF